MKRPSFQFYPGDWRNNAKLRRCSREARSVWMDILCVFHDSDEYGVLRWPLVDIANAADAPIQLVMELVDKTVLKGSDGAPVKYEHVPRTDNRPLPAVTLVSSEGGPCWFSSRMVVDEWRRQTKGKSTRFVAHQASDSRTLPILSQRQSTGSSSSSSSSSLAVAATGQEDADQIGRLNRILGFSETDFHTYAASIRTLANLKAEGCDFEKHILPAAEQAARGRKAKSLAYIAPKARELRDAAALVASMPVPFENTDERGWRARLALFRDKGTWLPKWGPKPDDDACKCPVQILSTASEAA